MEDFVPFEIAKKLKEKGFNEQCLAYYTKDSNFYYNTSYGSDVENAFKSFNSRPNHICGKRIDAPTISQVLKWLREKKYIFVCTEFFNYEIGFGYKLVRLDYVDNITENQGYKTYEQATLAGIEYVLNHLI